MSDTRVCIKCGTEKTSSDFYKRKRGFYSSCKMCALAAQKAIYQDKKTALLEYQKSHRIANKKKIAALQKVRYEANRDAKLAYRKAYVAANKERVAAARRVEFMRRKKADPVFAMRVRISSLIRGSFRNGGYTKRSRSHEVLGCDWATFKRHIELQFTKGMSWDRIGEIHLDHICPISTAVTEADVIGLNHFTNIRPLWAAENLAKRDTITHLI